MKKDQGIIVRAKLMIFKGLFRPPGQTGICKRAGTLGRFAAGVARVPRALCGRFLLSDREQEVLDRI